MASSSNAPLSAMEYLYASTTNVSSFVSVKLSGNGNYLLWKAQMICLMDIHNMCGLVGDPRPTDSGSEILGKYDSLLKGWIFGSLSEDVLVVVFDLSSAKDVWDKLESIYDPIMSFQQDSAPTKPEAKTETKDIDDVSSDTNTNDKESISKEIIGKDKVSIKIDEAQVEKKIEQMKYLREATIKGDWSLAECILKQNKDLATAVISGDGSTVLHIAVGIGHNDFVKNVFSYIKEDQELEKKRNSDGSTALHIAAIVGNTTAVELLVKKNKKLLRIKDRKGVEPLHKAYENMHLDTIGYLLKSVNDDENNTSSTSGDSVHSHLNPGVDIGVDVLVNAISAKQYKIASELIRKLPKFASKNDHVLMALAKTFPSGLDYWETAIYPLALNSTWKRICYEASLTIESYFNLPSVIGEMIEEQLWPIVAPIKHIENKKKEWDEARTILELVCNEIDKVEFSGSYHPYYKQPILEAASQNAYKVVDEILFRSPEAIGSKNKNGYDIIQLAVIHRSAKIYNLIYDIGERKNLYRTIEDSSKNNILHLAGKLAPSRELDQRAGAALQLQRELQWREEVKKLVFPTYITRENIFKETPYMVFTREHENLVREGEKWMKTTAESCSITAALITTIVFAAAITVPGGSNQETGIPFFRKEIAFTIFALSDAISLFASSTALLVFLSILTARFAEKDFLVSLPRRLFIGLFSLLLSTTAMMVAFSATLFLVFCDKKLWKLGPICGLAIIPIAFFVTIQFPLMVDLFRSTYLPIFGKERKSVLRKFNPDYIRLFFGTKADAKRGDSSETMVENPKPAAEDSSSTDAPAILMPDA